MSMAPHLPGRELPQPAGPSSTTDGPSLPVTPVATRDVPPDKPESPLQADEVNRLWQHGMHEERLFHDRLNYFSAIQAGLLGVFAILYHKEPSPGIVRVHRRSEFPWHRRLEEVQGDHRRCR